MKHIKNKAEKELETQFKKAIDYIKENNEVENSYHNNKHMIDVFDNSMILYDEMCEDFDLDLHDKECLGLAALFHDFGHSGGKLVDKENIEISIESLSIYLESINKSELYDDIVNIIKCTEFPHKDIELDTLQKIIRDADTIGAFMDKDDWLNIVKSLAEELGKTLKEFAPDQIKFMNNVQFNTDYCKELLEKNKADRISKLKTFL